jgi:hypothetical protein
MSPTHVGTQAQRGSYNPAENNTLPVITCFLMQYNAIFHVNCISRQLICLTDYVNLWLAYSMYAKGSVLCNVLFFLICALCCPGSLHSLFKHVESGSEFREKVLCFIRDKVSIYIHVMLVLHVSVSKHVRARTDVFFSSRCSLLKQSC